MLAKFNLQASGHDKMKSVGFLDTENEANNYAVSVIIKRIFPFPYWSMLNAEISAFKCNYDCNISDPAFFMLICHSVPLERNIFH